MPLSWFKVKFTSTITASVRWEIQQNLSFFVLVFQWMVPTNPSLQDVLYQLQFYQRWASFAWVFFKFWTKSVDGYFYLLFSLEMYSRKKSALLKLSHLITPFPILDQSNEIYFAASWWALIIKGRCNVVPLLLPYPEIQPSLHHKQWRDYRKRQTTNWLIATII